MKRSQTIHLVLLASGVVLLDGCGRQRCLDEHGVVVNDAYCRAADANTGGHGYHFVGGYGFGSSSGSSSSTVRGVFGSAGGHASGASGGE